MDSLFLSESGRFSVDIRDRVIQQSPWQRFTKIGKFPQGMGTTISDITVERVMTDSVETDWSAYSINTGTGVVNRGCIPVPSELEFGETVRTFSLETKSYMTPCICLDDLKSNYRITEQIGKTVKSLTQLTQYALDNRARAGYASVVPIVSLRPNFPEVAAGTGVTAAVPPPTMGMSQDILNKFRRIALNNGAFRNALGMENGQPVLGYITSDQASDDIIRANDDIRQDIRYAQPSALVQPLGIERSYRGLYHIIDNFLPRYEYNVGEVNPWSRVTPFVRSNTTNGARWDYNPDYEAAPYELQYLYHQDVMEVMVQQVGPNIPDAPFEDMPEYYTGEVFWLNIRNAENNPLGKIGRWLLIMTNAIRSVDPTIGYAFMTKRCVSTPNGVNCQYS